MRCTTCQRENPAGNVFCTDCGSVIDDSEPSSSQAKSSPAEPTPEPVAGLPGETADDSQISSESPAESIARLENQIRNLRMELGDIRSALYSSGVQVSLQRQPTPISRTPSAERSVRGRLPDHASTRGNETAGAPGYSKRSASDDTIGWSGFDIDWELIVGGNWLARIGVLAVVIGVGFFLALAFENNWIGETSRIVLGLVAGAGMVAGGEYFQRRYPVYGQALTGGGVAILYFSIFAAYALYSLIGIYPAIALLLIISVGAAVQAVRYESVALAVIGFLGAYSGPFILIGASSEGANVISDPNGTQLMAYILAVSLGVLGLSTFRNWRWFTPAGLIGALITYAFWLDHYEPTASLFVAHGGATAIFLIFTAATMLFHLVWRRPPEAFQYSVMFLNALTYVGITYGLLWEDYRAWMGLFTFSLALFYGGIAGAAYVWAKENIVLSLMSVGIASVLLTLVAPVQFDGPWVSIAWASESMVMMALSIRLEIDRLRISSYAIFALTTLWILTIETPTAISERATSELSPYLAVYLTALIAAYANAFMLRRLVKSFEEWEREIPAALLTAGNLFLTIAIFQQLGGVWIPIALSIETVVLMWTGARFGFYEQRTFALAVAAIAIVRIMFYEILVDADGYVALLNTRMAAYLSVIVALCAATYMLRTYREQLFEWEQEVLQTVGTVAANLLLLLALSAEIIGAVDNGVISVSGQAALNTKSLGLSLLWASYGSIGLVAGIVVGWRMVRVGSLVLLAIPILKLFLVDSFALESGYRVAAFLVLGVLLLIGGYLYQRYSETIKSLIYETGKSENRSQRMADGQA